MSRALVLVFQDDAGPALLADHLHDVGLETEVRDVLDAPDPAAYDAVVLLGGSPGAADDHPSVHAARDLVRTAAGAGVPTLGICLGHQVCAVALGGSVATSEHGLRLGLQDVRWQPDAADDPLLGGLTDVRTVTHWNSDVVTAVPDGGDVLARDVHGEVQAARFAPAVWGVQWHPEVDDRWIGAWADEDRARHPEGRVDAALANVALARERLDGDRRRLAEALAAVVAHR